MVERSNLIQVASDEWIVMREFTQYPKAVIRGMRDGAGEARFILSSWHPVRHKQQTMGLFASKEEAEAAVPWPSRNPPVPPSPHLPPEARAAHLKAEDVTGMVTLPAPPIASGRRARSLARNFCSLHGSTPTDCSDPHGRLVVSPRATVYPIHCRETTKNRPAQNVERGGSFAR